MNKFIKITFIATVLVFSTSSANAQYWFGAKAGVSKTDFVYQSTKYEVDSFEVSSNVNFNAGIAFNYVTGKMFSAYAELIFEKFDKSLQDIPENGANVRGKMTTYFLSAPFMFRAYLTNGNRMKFYANLGPRFSWWLGGKASYDLRYLEEGTDDVPGQFITKPIAFRSSNSTSDEYYYIQQPQQIQYGLVFGGGSVFEMANGARVMLDFRYDWGHSHMAFNSIQDAAVYGDPINSEYYRENYQYSQNTITVSVGYFIAYNADLRRKGKSTMSASNKGKSKKRRRR